MAHRMGNGEPDPAPNWDVKDVINQIQEELSETNNNQNNLRPTIRYCAFTPTTLSEDTDTTDTKDKLTNNITDTPITQNHTEQIFIEPQAPLIPLEDANTHKYKTKSTTRIMRKAINKELPAIVEFRLHLDGGANLSVTPNHELLINFRRIRKHAISGVAEGAPALYATGIGYLPWRAQNGTTLLVKCYYSEYAADTIISPTDVVINKLADFHAWSQFANVDNGKGYIAFHHRDGKSTTTFPLTSHNGLWYYQTTGLTDFRPFRAYGDQGPSTVMRITKQGEWQLYHYRFGCAGEDNMEEINKHVDDCPQLRCNRFWKCRTCMQEKATYRTGQNPATDAAMDRAVTKNAEDITNEEQTPTVTLSETIPDKDLRPGQMFQMDYGFVRGSGYSTKDEDGRRITSLDGMNCYLIIIDRKTRRTWVFLQKSKTPPIETVRSFLQKNKCRTTGRLIIRSDQGGELYKSDEFQKMADSEGFILEPTAAKASFQNGMVERPNRTLARIMGCLLTNAGLGPEYWSWALIHAVYLKNRMPHRATGETPYFSWSGKKPSAKHLRIFGCPVIVKLPGLKPAKLDHNTAHGIFLGYTATDHNIYYQDYKTRRIKIATHVKFDEAGWTLPSSELPPAMKALQELGSREPVPTTVPGEQDLEPLQVQLLSDNAKIPAKATEGAAGYDIYSAEEQTIAPHSRKLINTDIAIAPPPGTYGQITSRSGLALKYGIDTRAGVIDSDYRGNIGVLLENTSDQAFTVKPGDRIAQLILYYIANPQVETVQQLNETERGSGGFGSTGINSSVVRTMQNTEDSTTHPPNIVDQAARVQTTPSVHECTDIILQEDCIKPYDIWLSDDPYDNRLTITIDVKGSHPTLGMQLVANSNETLQLADMSPSTPAAKVAKWRSTLRWSTLLSIDGKPIHTTADVEAAIATARQEKKFKVHCVFATEKRYGVHPNEGSLMLYFDQLNAFAKHIYEADREYFGPPDDDKRDWVEEANATPTQHLEDAIRTMTADISEQKVHNPADDPELGKFFKKREILQREDFPEWRASCFKQLDQYLTQGMFSEPMRLPKGTGASYMHWTFLKKMCGTKKARMVFDGARNRNHTTLGYTYANSVDAPSERLFWALTAKFGLIAVGADVSNAFAEAPAPKEPVYMYIDEFFRDWWENHLGRPKIPEECNVVRVCKAIQGHPESPRLWEKHIDRILQEAGFKPTRHEPCLYSATVKGELVLFLRQVDDFSVSAKSTAICSDIIKYINSKMSMDVKDLGIIGRFNGVDVFQTKHYVKITCERYLTKMLQAHDWMLKGPPPTNPLPLPSEQEFARQLEQAKPPSNQLEKDQLRETMGFNYRQVIGEFIWPMVKCRPEYAPHIIRLSQHNDNPAKEHYLAARQLADYLAATITEGIYYWRDQPVDELPEGELPHLHSDNYTMQTQPNATGKLIGLVDSDWAGDSVKRKSMTGVIIMLAGGAIAYKAKYQDVIALSTTEAEFVAACDAAKMILFFRSILEDLGIPQEEATVLYEDNNGALMMANAQQPTKRTRHMDIKLFSLLDWVERDLTILKDISTHDNAADAMTKMLPRQLFYRHMDTYMGKRIPPYVSIKTSSSVPKSKIMA